MRPSVALKSIKNQEWLHPSEAVYCHWKDGYLRAEETQICRRTRLSFDSSLIDKTGQFNRLTTFASGEIAAEDGQHLIEQFRSLQPIALNRLKKLFFIRSRPKSRILFLRGDVKSKWPFLYHYVIFAARVKDNSAEILTPMTEQFPGGEWKPFS